MKYFKKLYENNVSLIVKEELDMIRAEILQDDGIIDIVNLLRYKNQSSCIFYKNSLVNSESGVFPQKSL